MALTFAYYLIQFLRLIFSIIIVGFGYVTIPDFLRNLQKGLWHDNVFIAIIIGFAIVAFIACNKLISVIEDFREKLYFTKKNKHSFQFCALTIIGYVFLKYSSLLFIISFEKGELAITDWWQNEATQPSELISFGLLACFFWVIAQLIEEGIAYKNENDLTI